MRTIRCRVRGLRWVGAMGVLFWLATAPTVDANIYDRPDPAMTGGVTGKVSPIDQLEAVVLFEPTDERLFQARINRAAGRFEITGLPPGRYDLLLKFRDVAVEGVSLNVPGPPGVLDSDEVEAIYDRIWKAEDYFNDKTITRLAGNPGRARAVVVQIRDRVTYRPDGTEHVNQLIRRIDVINLRKSRHVWMVRDTRHLFREERRKDAPGAVLPLRYAPQLSEIRVADQKVEAPAFDLKAFEEQEDVAQRFHRAHYREKGVTREGEVTRG